MSRFMLRSFNVPGQEIPSQTPPVYEPIPSARDDDDNDNGKAKSFKCRFWGWWTAVVLVICVTLIVVPVVLAVTLPNGNPAKKSASPSSSVGQDRSQAHCVTDETLDPVTGTCMMVPHFPSAVAPAIMDQQTAPCSDYYRYACGKWIDEHSNTNRGFTSLALKNTVLTDNIVLNASNTALHGMFKSCTALFLEKNRDKQIQTETAAVRRVILDHILEPLKALEDLPRVFGRLASFGYTSPLTFSIQSNPFVPGIVPSISYDGFSGIADNVPWVAKHFALLHAQAPVQEMARKLTLMVADMPVPPLSPETGQMASLEEWHDYLADAKNKAADLIPFSELPALFSLGSSSGSGGNQTTVWNWSHFVEEASHGTITLSPEQRVWVPQRRRFLDAFRPGQFSLPQWRLYVEWSVLYHTHDFFPDLEEDVLFSFSSHGARYARKTGALKKRAPSSSSRNGKRKKRGVIAPGKGQEGSWDPQGVSRDDCLRLTKYLLPGQVSRRYLDAHFPPERRAASRARITEMVQLIKTMFRARLAITPWMDEETRRVQSEKIASIVARVVEPLEGHWVEEDVHMDPLRYVKNLNEIQSLRVKRNLAVWSESRYGQACDSTCRDKITAFGSPLSIVNAWYNPDRNVITIPAGILQPPFYEDRYDNVSAYATIGMVIAHELSHAQDPKGSLFDKDGLLRDTWSQEARRAYETKAQCLVREYDSDNGVTDTCQGFSSAMVSPERGTYGTLTLCENTADQVGLTLALDALGMTYGPRQGLQMGRVPDDDLKQFFLAFSQMWCSTYDQEAMCERADDVHSLANLRVGRTLAHQAEFSRVYGCLVGEPMHRLERCEIF